MSSGNALFVIALGLATSATGHGFMDSGAHIGGLVSGALLGLMVSLGTPPLARPGGARPAAAGAAPVPLAFAWVLS